MGIILDKDFCPYIFVAKPPPINEKISMEYVMNLNKEKTNCCHILLKFFKNWIIFGRFQHYSICSRYDKYLLNTFYIELNINYNCKKSNNINNNDNK